MIIVRYRHESDENYFLNKMKKMKHYLEEVIDCVESKDGEYDDDDSYDEEDDGEFAESNRMKYRRGGRMSRRGGRMRGRYNFE